VHFFSAGLKILEARLTGDLATGSFCHGETATIADICLFALYEGAGTFEIKVEGIPTVDRIVTQCRTLPAFTDAHPIIPADRPRAAAVASRRPDTRH
jgi:glutathione S-transferase